MNTLLREAARPQPPMHAAGRTNNEARIRVLLVISNFEYGGAQRQIVELANNADPARMEVHVCSLSDYTPLAMELQIPSDRFHIIPKRARFDASVVMRLARLLRRLRVDVVHGYLFDAEIAVRLAGRLSRTPLVVGSERNTDYSLKRVQLAAYRLTRSHVDVIVANSNAGAAFNSRALGHHPDQYRVVHNGVDTSHFVPRDRIEARAPLGIDAQARVVGMFASFKAQKNHPLLLAATQHLVARIPGVKILLVGDELHGGMHGSREYRARMEALIDERGLRAHCLCLGNRDDVAALYPACDVTVLPSLFEGTPNVALESMACGVPVVATNVSDNALIVPDGRAGFIVPLGDERALADRLERTLTDSPLRQAMGCSARAWVEREFSTRRLAEKTEAVYREWLGLRAGMTI